MQAEHQWLRDAYGGGTLVRQVLGASSDGRRRYDVITWRKPDGETVEVCFDVTTVFVETIRQVEEEEVRVVRLGSPRPRRGLAHRRAGRRAA